MESKEIRKKFLDFFEKKGHKIVPSSSLLPTDPSVLFTTAGMQQFKEYYLGKESPYGSNVASCQKCFRTSDIEEVGDIEHLTFLEMLGNFSFGGYFKKETIELAWEFLVGPSLKLDPERFWITIFKGEGDIPKDEESYRIWKECLGIDQEKIYEFDREDNFWGPTGKEGPCGPTCEIYYDLTGKPCSKGKNCIPSCDCGRFIELWNLVFNEYYQNREKKLSPLKQKGVDTGMGLERLAMVMQNKDSVFEIDLFQPIIKEIEKQSLKSYCDNRRAFRIIADHIRGAVFLASEGIAPSNLEQGYVLRRILRRAIRFGKLLGLTNNFLIPLAQKVIAIYQDVYPEIKTKETDILIVFQKEEEKFEKTLEKGLKEFDKLLKSKIKNQKSKIIEGKEAFDLYQNYGFPLELTEELAKEKGLEVDKQGFAKNLKKHQEISRAGAEKKFGGHGIKKLQTTNYKLQITKLHTATHLLHQALREVLGEHIKQMGSDITPQRLRFDFSHPTKVTPEELKKVEDLVNQKIKEDLKVQREEMPYEKAIKSGALAFFKQKYPKIVSVYSINNWSKEICAGPHVQRTGELGSFKIIKEESSGAGVRRIRAVLK
ncbi:alanine--tRNA ligase [bacterium]|nr:alanine--tRNA ligase [bacterium]